MRLKASIGVGDHRWYYVYDPFGIVDPSGRTLVISSRNFDLKPNGIPEGTDPKGQ